MTNLHESSRRMTVSVWFDGSEKISSPDGDVRHVWTEPLEQFVHLFGHGRESFEGQVASDDGRSKRRVGFLQPFDDVPAERSAGLVAKQQYQSLVFVRSDLHPRIVDRKRLQSKGRSSIRGDGTSPPGSGTVHS